MMAAIFDNALSLGTASYNRYNWHLEGREVKTEAVMAEIQSEAVTSLPEPMTAREREILASWAHYNTRGNDKMAQDGKRRPG